MNHAPANHTAQFLALYCCMVAITDVQEIVRDAGNAISKDISTAYSPELGEALVKVRETYFELYKQSQETFEMQMEEVEDAE